ncbi:hypothetical protein HYPDE_26738 [Hyphomicrobium denitrificans 1NES1]|uniref:Uncharacterized protein n=1 Tax=Hyphomicrobium denitrificans 1NES1 TaxID=670307 RepID=N0B273_9HYPH|nr:hypothetical protein [Hyphomicrobium denitrificans]AGK57028.1 hypothetical protein HYPDE_26738 [Hyphomicrobium denitrificans 1NES1]
MPETDLLAHIGVTFLIYALLYGAAAMTMIGFAMMLGGPSAAQAAAEFFILRPLMGTATQVANLIAAVLAFAGRAIMALATSFVRFVIDPILRPIAYLLRRFIAGPPA